MKAIATLKLLYGQFIPRNLSKRRDVIFVGEKPSLYFVRHPEERWKGNYNATPTDCIFQRQIRKYLKRAVYITDMVKTEGKAGALFEREWENNPNFSNILSKELGTISPKIIVAISKKVYELLRDNPRWEGMVRYAYHPYYVVRYAKYAKWNAQFEAICNELK